MPRENVIQANFTSGEVSPYIAGRIDTKVYANGVRTCENFVVRPQGGVSRRLGTRHVKTSWTRNKTSLLVPFVFSDVQAYVLQFGDGFIHFYKDGEPLLESTTTEIEEFSLTAAGGLYQVTVPNLGELPGWGAATSNGTITLSTGDLTRVRVTTTVPHTLRTGVSVIILSTEIPALNNTAFVVERISAYAVDLVGSTYVIPSAGTTSMFSHGLLAGDRFYISGAPLYTDLTEQFHTVASVLDTLTFTIANKNYVNSGAVTGEEAWTIPIEVVTPYAESELAELRFAQSADVLYIMHPDHPVMKLTRLDNDGDRLDWLLSEVVFTDGPYLPLNDDAPTVDTVTPANGSRFPDVSLEVSSYSHTAVATITQAAKAITNVANDGAGNFRFTVVGHGWVTGQSVTIAGTGVAAANGHWVITRIDADRFDADASTFAAGWVSGGTAQLIFTDGTDDDGSHYLEYRHGDQWKLALVTAGGINASTRGVATVQIIDNVLLYLDEDVSIRNRPDLPAGAQLGSLLIPNRNTRSINAQARLNPRNSIQGASGAGDLVASYSNTFSTADLGKFVRYHDNTTTPATAYWALINKVPTAGGTTVNHAASVAMVTANDDGGFVISSEERGSALKAYRTGSLYALFAATDIGRHVRLGWGGRWTWGIITAFTSESHVTLELYEDPPRDPHNALNLAGASNGSSSASSTSGSTFDWRLGAWSETTGFPSCAVFHEQRLLFGRTDTQPATFWGSVTGDFENMRPTELDSTVLDDNAINYTLASGRVNAIKWMESGTTLVIGTNGGEWVVGASSLQQEALTQLNITTRLQSRNGSSPVAQPIRIGSSIIFVDRSEQKVKEVSYLFLEDRLQDKDLTVASDHIIRRGGTVVQTAFQQNPHSIGWFLLSDGTLAGVTYNADQEVIAWHHHTLGGVEAFIESICVVPNPNGTSDDIYMLVSRGTGILNEDGTLILGETGQPLLAENPEPKRYIEVLEAEFYPASQDPIATLGEDGRPTIEEDGLIRLSDTTPTSRLGMQFVDCARVINGFTGTVITGLAYLTGEAITVVGDGTKIPLANIDYDDGALTLPEAYDEVVIGIAYTSTLKSLPPEGGSAHGTSQGMTKKLVEMKARVADSMGMNVAVGSAFVTYDFNAGKNTWRLDSETTLPFFSGTVPIVPRGAWREDVPWTINYGLPYPLNVLAVVSVLETTK